MCEKKFSKIYGFQIGQLIQRGWSGSTHLIYGLSKLSSTQLVLNY